MMDLNYNDVIGTINERLANGGVFLNTAGDTPNTMTIGWAYMGVSWRKNIFIAMVRPQRHTYELIEKTGEFTVSVPTGNPLRAELGFAGTASGRDVNKFDGHGLTAAPARQVKAPIVGECGLHLECRVVSRQKLSGEHMDEAIRSHAYPGNDYHMLYFGEVIACYSTDD